MPDPDIDRIIILAQSGVTVRQAEAAIGRRMTEGERQAWDKAQVRRQLEKAARKARGPKSVADRVYQHHAQHSLVEWRECADPKRRARLEKNRPAWLRHYFAGVFFRPFEEPHFAIINGSTEAVRTGGRFTVAAERGIGKALALDTPIPTPDGWKTIGDIAVGDALFDDQGNPCKVVAKSPVFKNRDSYLVEINHEKDPIVADADHIWVAEMDRRKGFKEYTTRQIAEPTNRSQSRAAVVVAPALNLPEIPLPLDPYFLGLWLGDGRSNGPSITTADEETVEWLKKFAAQNGLLINDAVRNNIHQVSLCHHTLFGKRHKDKPKFIKMQKQGEHAHDYYQCACGKIFVARRNHVASGATKSCGCLSRNPIKDALETMGILNNKHIPAVYLRAGKEQRLELLRGLIDTDGHVQKTGGVEFCNTNHRLACDVLELVRTLGVKANLKEDRARVNGRDCGPRYRVTFYMDRCATIPRKAARCKNAGTMTRHYLHATPCGKKDTVCIQVSAKSGMFLAGRSMTPTHNSVIEWSLAVIDVFSGVSPFPAYVPWQASAVKRAFRFWKNALCFNPDLLADYPEFCAPFAHSRGVAQRLASTVWKGGPNDGQPTGAQLAICDGMIILPDSKGCIGSATINGNPRGLNHPTPDGRVLRPTSAILDDVQDRDVAKSAVMVQDTIAIIDGDVAGMGEAGVKLPMLMTGNCIAPNDVMAHYLAAENWHSIRVPCVVSWPEGWGDGNGATAKIWETWHELYKAKEKHAAFYRANKDVLTKGFRLSSPGVYAGKREFPDAFCGVIESYYRMGKEAFHAEKQQKPLDPIAEAAVHVTPEIVLSRAIGPPKGTAPEGAIRILAAADINPGITSRLGARITWTCAGFAMHQTEGVMAYGIHPLAMPADPTPSQQVSIVYAGLNDLRLKLDANYGCTKFGYDARGWMNKGVTRGQALRYARVPLPNCGCAAIGMEGWSSEQYSPKNKTAIRQYEACHLARDRVEQQTVEWIAWNTDWFNLQQMRAWLAAPGSPGSCMLYTGNHDREFLNQVTTRAFMGMVQKHRGQAYDWARSIGSDDFGDCLAMCRALAASEGIGTGENTEVKKKRNIAVMIGGRRIEA